MNGVSAVVVGRRTGITLAALGIVVLSPAIWAEQLTGHAWEFEVKTPGTYELQVEHRVGVGVPFPPNRRVEYIIETKEQPFGRSLRLIENQRFSALTATVASPQRIRVIVSGLPPRILQQTRVYVFEAETFQASPANYDPGPLNNVPVQSKRASSSEPTFSKEVEKLLALPESKIDVGLAAFTLAKEIYPEIDIAAYSKRLDELAQKVKSLANDPKDPETRIRALNTVLHLNEDFRYDHSPGSRENLDNLFLHRYLDRRRGTCVTMPLLYVAAGQRLGYPIYPVVAPDHMFARYSDPSFELQNIEATSGGKFFPNDEYVRRFFVSDEGLKSGSYMRTMTRRELLGQLLAANAAVYGREGQAIKSMKYLEKAIQLDPKFADHYDNLQMGYLTLSKAATNLKQAAQYREKAKKYGLRAKALGFVNPSALAGVGLRGT